MTEKKSYKAPDVIAAILVTASEAARSCGQHGVAAGQEKEALELIPGLIFEPRELKFGNCSATYLSNKRHSCAL
jgi:hypothetical protein